MMNAKDVAIVAAFFMEGLRDNDYDAVIEAWGHGCVEMVSHVAQYAEPLWRMARAGWKLCGDFPGVFDYEVSSPFGHWFGQQVLESKDPTPEECKQWLIEATLKFFMQGGGDEQAMREALTAAWGA